MSKTLQCILVSVLVLVTTPVFAGVVETGDVSFTNVGLDANTSVFGSVIYSTEDGPLTISGTVTNWNGDVNSSWQGLWPCIGLTPTHFFNMTGTTVTGYTHLGDSNYGDTSHQMGLGALSMVFYEKSAQMIVQVEDYATSGYTNIIKKTLEGDTFDFELVYDFEAKTMSGSFAGSAFATRDITTPLAESDSFILQIFATNNDPTILTMGYDLSYEVNDASLVAGDANNDGKVDGSDVTILACNWQTGVGGVGGANWSMGDFNGDGAVDGSDVTILAGNWQYGVTTAAASVPEPSTLALLLAAMVSFYALRRR